ncbi:hypothetical protein K1X12_02140 [Hyphomonas sp. WL0036]|uniref:hypothetical protein n=1 Tax=Hyphomonas sediminis TaxID=2866160 RepID=UPI001C7E708D|nr:hypothetical protein [Hyphomonas sediminis]MBY9065679.1 hypothetical protein [Hyphomonas sediminis]
MKFRILVGAGLGLLATACAHLPGGSAAPAACASQLAESAAYLQQHVDAREEKLKVIRFASEEAMNAYNDKTTGYDSARIDFIAMGNIIEAAYGLPEATGTAPFDHTTDEEADARIAEGKSCAAPLLE